MERYEDHTAEAAVLGAVLMGKGRKDHVIRTLREDDFADTGCREVFRAMATVATTGAAIDFQTTLSVLRRSVGSDEAAQRAAERIADLTRGVPTSHNVEHYADVVRELSACRALVSVDVRRAVKDADDSSAAITELRRHLDEIERRNIARSVADGLELARLASARLEEAKARGPGPKGVRTGYYKLDRRLSGLRRSGHYVLGARPAHGKTALAVNIASHVAINERRCVLVFSLEMDKGELADRFVASEARINSEQISSGEVDMFQWAAVSRELGKLSESKFFVDDRGGLGIDDLTASARRIHNEHGPIGLIVVDYLQLVRGTKERRRGEREQEVAEVSRGLKMLAKALDCPVLSLSQLNRDLEKREDKKPRTSDFRESGAIEADADVLLALYRPAVYHADADPAAAELIVLKNRHGPVGMLSLRWSAEIVRFDNLQEDIP